MSQHQRNRVAPGPFYWFARAVACGALACVRRKVYGDAHLPQEPHVIVCNHTSFLDPLLLGLSLPYPVHFLARSTLFRGPFGWVLHQGLAHPLQRGSLDRSLMDFCQALLRSGQNIALFPEGQRGDGMAMLPFKPGAALLALSAGVPVLPVFMQGPEQLWPKGRRWPRLWGKVSVRIGQPMLPPQQSHGTLAEQARAWTEEIERAVHKLSKEEGARDAP